VDSLGVEYHAAAIFDHAIDVVMPAGLGSVDFRTHLNVLVEKAAHGAAPEAC
jgi:hypothetical protein